MAKIMENSGYKRGKGLGAKLQGVKGPISLSENLGRQGLGFEPSLETRMKQLRIGKGKDQTKVVIPHIRETFPYPSKIINLAESIAMTSMEVKFAFGKMTPGRSLAIGIAK